MIIKQRMMSFSLPGRIVYDPTRRQNKVGDTSIHHGRCIIKLLNARDLCRYYAFQFYKKFGLELLQPDWEPHVTVIAKSQFNKKKNDWGYKNGQNVKVQYSHQMFWNDEHVWIAVECPELMEIREHYGNLSYDRGHMTIGRFRVDDVNRLPHFKKPGDLELWNDYIWNKPV